MISLRKEIKDSKVSSVLNGDRKMYGKKYLFDGNEETCWNSDKGEPQWIEFGFSSEKDVTQVTVQFQGGFASKSCTLECLADADSKGNSMKCEFHPKDTNELQTFLLNTSLASKRFKLIFNSSYDFYGRIIIYDLDVFGS